MDFADELPRMPFEQNCVLDIPPTLRRLQAEGPITRVRTPAGDVAWLVTGYDEVRVLIADEQLGRSHPCPERAARISGSALLGGPMGNYETEQADHTRMRKLLAPAFSARRMRALRERVDLLVSELLDRMAGLTPPADLHEHLSVPLPVLVICELLGVPYDDRAEFRAWSDGSTTLDDAEGAAAAFGELVAYMRRLVERKRIEPGQDLISDMISANDEARLGEGGFGANPPGEPDLGDDGIAFLACGLLFAGHETTLTRIDLGLLLLLTNAGQRAELLRDPSLLPGAVEEILRLAAPGDSGLPRYAHADIDIACVTIQTGDLVLLSPTVANRDPLVFDAPERFDIRREPNPHIAFGYGGRFCLGAHLARIELQAVFRVLFERFPTLDLAVPLSELRLRRELMVGGLAGLPVTW
jgi:cytochrome P450